MPKGPQGQRRPVHGVAHLDLDVDWSAAADAPAQIVNVFAVQANQHFHVLNLGFAAPPVLVSEADMQRASKLTSLPAQSVARIVLTPADLRKLVKVLSDNIETREKLFSEKPQ